MTNDESQMTKPPFGLCSSAFFRHLNFDIRHSPSTPTYLDLGHLPRASQKHPHYEAATNADTLMMALLRLSITQTPPPSTINLTYTNR